jgi:hypothetical protein
VASPDPAPQVTYETVDEGRIARIWLNRPDAQNAQSRTLLVQLDEAFGRAEADDAVRVVILAGRGKNFSAGHDLGSEAALLERQPGPAQHPTFRSHGSTKTGIAERTYLQEWHYFFENTRRWRDLRKITIAQVQGMLSTSGSPPTGAVLLKSGELGTRSGTQILVNWSSVSPPAHAAIVGAEPPDAGTAKAATAGAAAIATANPPARISRLVGRWKVAIVTLSLVC